MASDVKINWYADQVLALAVKATREGLLQLAFQIEGEAKVRAPVDTGFLRNSAYVVGAGTSTFHTKHSDDRDTVNHAPKLTDDEIAVGFAADYAVYVETNQPFLYPALVSATHDTEGAIVTAGKRYFA